MEASCLHHVDVQGETEKLIMSKKKYCNQPLCANVMKNSIKSDLVKVSLPHRQHNIPNIAEAFMTLFLSTAN